MKKYRLKKGHEFKRVLRRGIFKQNLSITIYVLKNSFKYNRIGICVTKKNGKSVDRNKLKRWVRESYRNILKENNIQNSFDIVIMYKKSATILNSDYNGIKNQLYETLNQFGILKSKVNI